MVAVQQVGDSGADGDSLGGSAIERVGTEPGALALVERVESAIRKVQQLRLEMGSDEIDVDVDVLDVSSLKVQQERDDDRSSGAAQPERISRTPRHALP